MSYLRTLVAVYVVLSDERGRVLMLRRKDTGFADGLLTLVAGHVEEGESVIDAAVRETREEAGVVVDPADLTVRAALQRHSGEPRIDFFAVASRHTGTPYNAEPRKCSEVLWVGPKELPDDVIDHVRTGLENCDTGAFYAAL